jgi:transcriptional regulator with XRE-family HTH domain
MNESINKHLGEILKQHRLMVSMTLLELSSASHISSSHLGRIERGERYPSARTLKRLACPLRIDEAELMLLAGYLSHDQPALPVNSNTQLDPYVNMILSQETIEVQRVVVSILSILKVLSER